MGLNPRSSSDDIQRRTLLKGTLSAGALTIISIPGRRAARSSQPTPAPKPTAPSDKVNLACIGIGGRGNTVSRALHATGMVNVVALCDVNMGSSHTSAVCNKFPNAPRFKDFRKMFDKMAGKIDAVSIAVPDHSHFPAAMLSMSLGKHIYVEKPLAHRFREVELMMQARKKYKVATQMGNQGHSGNNYFQFEAWVKAGIIKNVTRVTAYMNIHRRWHGWRIKGYPTGETKPTTMDWDTWLATARHHEFSSKYAPGNWRSWYDFGNGAFGDWGPHTLDTVHRFLKLGLPVRVSAEKLDGPSKFIFPQATTISFSFPARGKMPPVKITWYDGTKNLPPQPKELEKKRRLRGCGKVIFSDEFVFKGGTHGATLRIIPESKMREVQHKLPRITGKNSNHFSNFILACRGEEKCRSSFDISGPLTEVFLLGVIAQRLGGTLDFDRRTRQITNNSTANKLLLGPAPRKGWEEFYKMV